MGLAITEPGTLSVVDLHSKILDARPPPGSKFFQFHAVFGKIWQNRMLAPPPPESWHPLLREILDPPLSMSSGLFGATTLKHINEKCDTNGETKVSQCLLEVQHPFI